MKRLGKLCNKRCDCDTDAATADSGENEVRRRNMMRECEDTMMEDIIQTWIRADGSMG